MIKKEIMNCLDNLGYKIEDADSDLVVENQIDSLNFIQLLIEIESCFNIIIPDQYLTIENFTTLNRIILTLETIISSSEVTS